MVLLSKFICERPFIVIFVTVKHNWKICCGFLIVDGLVFQNLGHRGTLEKVYKIWNKFQTFWSLFHICRLPLVYVRTTPCSQFVQKCNKIFYKLQVALSDLFKLAEENNYEDINAYITPIEGTIKCMNNLKRKDIILEFLDILCYPGAVIKHIDLSIKVKL